MSQRCRQQDAPIAKGASPVESVPSSGPPKLLAETDAKMLKILCVKDYFRYIPMTMAGKEAGNRMKPHPADR
ncbi:hypothetical protein IEN85_18225 [Pelagicoccus sp. NFK12]|uniref:Uncharacterized protein n=1 Tax=Pelagicoccus enzymogenes TaxID=2773457 RepID=A0A927FBP0_9BACT|nr:hypothetical protein [Pelagicoccus enzymogenes]MBD5781444.1 hypothetical protein [Pelagicoccus enzymogenes]